MQPAHRRCNDDGLVSFALDADTFTVSMASLAQRGPEWCAGQGVYVARAGAIAVEQRSFAVQLQGSVLGEPPAPDATVVAVVRFRFTNRGDAPATATSGLERKLPAPSPSSPESVLSS
jgi:hypothetical protein